MADKAIESGISFVEVRVSNFRSLQNVSVKLNDLTLLVGANNTGKTTFLDAIHAAVGSSVRSLGKQDIFVATHSNHLFPDGEQVHLRFFIRFTKNKSI